MSHYLNTLSCRLSLKISVKRPFLLLLEAESHLSLNRLNI